MNTAEEDLCRDPTEELGEEFLIRRRNGESVSIEDYASVHPAIADNIRLHFRTLVALERFKNQGNLSGGIVQPIRLGSGDHLGDFRIIRELGRGGMGVVYEAEQESLRRLVAVKVFPGAALADQDQLDRFHREARTAARLHHSNVVPVFGVGEQDGLHYFVMQRIVGAPLDRLIAGREESTVDPVSAQTRTIESNTDLHTEIHQRRESLSSGSPSNGSNGHSDWRWVARIGIQVAEAVAYAHDQGILHRDIKPGNLILDQSGVVWVADFGLATLMDLDHSNDQGKIVGTLRFMAPEQICGCAERRSDIYCIGATLYELATKRAAFESTSRAKLLDRIAKGEFRPPRSVSHAMPRDLESIIVKAMSCKPEMRYCTAGELSDDLRRFVDGKPVRARRIGVSGRLIRWSRRSPLVASLTAALILGTAVSFAAVHLKWREAVTENARAEENLSLALEALDHILQRYTSGWMAAPTPQDPETANKFEALIPIRTVVSDHSAAVLKDALRFYDEFVRKNPTSPRVQLDISRVHRRVADIYLRLGQHQNAEKAYLRSLSILNRQMQPHSLPLALQRAQIRNQLGLTYHADSRFLEACTEFEKAQSILSHSSLATDIDCRVELARACTNLGYSRWLMFQNAEARKSHRRSISILEDVVQSHPEQPTYRLALAQSYRAYYPLATSRRDNERVRIRSEGIAMLESLVRDYPDVPDYQCELCEMLSATARSRRGSRVAGDHLPQLDRAIALARNLTESHPSIPQYRAVLGRGLMEYGSGVRKENHSTADEIVRESIAIYRSLAGEFPSTPVYRILLARTLKEQSVHFNERQRHDEALEAIGEAIEVQFSYVSMRPGNPYGSGFLSGLYSDLSDTLVQCDQPDAAEAAREEADRLWMTANSQQSK